MWLHPVAVCRTSPELRRTIGIVFAALWLAGCGGGGGGNSNPAPPPVAAVTAVSVSCSPETVQTNQEATCSATVTGTGSPSTAVTWSVSPASAGTITSAGVFTPSASGAATITATSTQDPSKAGSAAITVNQPPATITAVDVSCSTTTVQTDQTATCAATVTGTGSPSTAVTWSVSPSSAGTITSAGVFTPSATGAATITATSTQDPSKTGSAALTVSQSPMQAYYREQNNQIVAGNAKIELTFNRGNGSLVNLVDKTTGKDFLSFKNAFYNGLGFAYRMPGSANAQNASGGNAQAVTFSQARTASGIKITMQLANFVVQGVQLQMAATVTITVDDLSPLTRWGLSIANNDQFSIEWFELPLLSGVGQLSTDPNQDYAVHPSTAGVLFQDPVHTLALNRGWGFSQYYPGYTNMQFLAYYGLGANTGLYLSSQDPAGHIKAFSMSRRDPNWMTLSAVHVPTFQPGTNITLPYEVVVGAYHGDWYDAAMLYREWAVQQPWAQKGKLAVRTDTPEWYKRMGMSGWANTAPFTPFQFVSLAPTATEWKSHIQSTPQLTWIYWENHGAWRDSPDFLPPHEGWPAFDAAVAATHTAGGKLEVELTTNTATVTSTSWNSLQPEASRRADGSLYQSTFNSTAPNGQIAVQTNAQMDPTQGWHDALLSNTTPLAQHGVDMIHMDGNPLIQGICYATNHGHPPGGGDWWFQNYAKIWTDVRAAGKAANPDLAMGGEYYAEPYIGLTDSGQDPTNTGVDPTNIGGDAVLDHTKVSYVPLWQAVYHDYTLTYSIFSFLDGHDKPYYRRGLGLPLVWGERPQVWAQADGAAAFPAKAIGFDAQLLEYVRRIVALRTTYGYPFVVLGRMLRPPRPTVPTHTVPAATRIPYTLVDTQAFQESSILSSAWQSPGGDSALVFTNIADTTVPFSWTVTAADVALDAANSYNVYVLKNGVCEGTTSSVQLPRTVNLTLDSTDVSMVLLSQTNLSGTAPFVGCPVQQ